MLDTDWLTLLSAAALGFSVLNYVLLEGTDLGVGVLMGLTSSSKHRRAMAVTILPIWDANETWLVLGGGGLLALLPLAYAVLLPALYLPFVMMFLALILRAVALEFRDHVPSDGIKRAVDGLLLVGSVFAGGCQGGVLGTLVQGVPNNGGQYNGDGWEWLGMFPLYCVAVLVVGYTWLGACWLYWRTVDELHRRSLRQARLLGLRHCRAVGGVGCLDSHIGCSICESAFRSACLAAVLNTVHCAADRLYLGLSKPPGISTAVRCMGIFVLAFTLMITALFPLIVPPQVTLQAAASSSTSQIFMLVGVAVLVPVTLIYNTYGFRVFSGKVDPASDVSSDENY